MLLFHEVCHSSKILFSTHNICLGCEIRKLFLITHRHLVKSAYLKFNFLISKPKYMLWVLKTYVKTGGKEKIYKFTLKIFVYLNL